MIKKLIEIDYLKISKKLLNEKYWNRIDSDFFKLFFLNFFFEIFLNFLKNRDTKIFWKITFPELL